MLLFPEDARVRDGEMGTKPGGPGLFLFRRQSQPEVQIRAIADVSMGWEHVSVSVDLPRCPNWHEMCAVKGAFWTPEDCVVQYHPAESEYVNAHPFVLHLWRPAVKADKLPRPPAVLVNGGLDAAQTRQMLRARGIDV